MTKRFLTRWIHQLGLSRVPSKARVKQARLRCEALEPRWTPAVVYGTEGADTIRINYLGFFPEDHDSPDEHIVEVTLNGTRSTLTFPGAVIDITLDVYGLG